MNNPHRLARGFTLIELMIVVSIIGILAMVALPKFADLVRKSQEGSTKGGIGGLRSALNIYYASMEGLFPNPNMVSPMDLLVNAKALSAVPIGKAPPYHPPSPTWLWTGCTQFGANDWNSLWASCITTLNGIESVSGGYWFYVWIGDSNGIPRDANFVVACTHTDSKGSIWSTY